MTPERWQQIEHIFHIAYGLSTSERAAYSAEACGDDIALREEVESLLASMERPLSVLDDPPAKDGLRILAADQAPALIGQTLDNYKILSWLGEGGMGQVYLAQDTVLGRKVALKLLPDAAIGDEDLVRRLRAEAQTTSALNHPNIITIHEIKQSDSQAFIATEFIQGETLRQQLRGGRMGVREALDIAIQIASALAAAHHEKIIHRDLKPENVMLRDDGYVKVLDFGIAEFKERQSQFFEPWTETAATQTLVTGTVGYMSPEQALGKSLDASTDLFSLGVLLYEMLSGRSPFEAETDAEALRKLLTDEPAPLSSLRSNVPPALESIIGKALRKNRDERYKTAGEMLTDLKALKNKLELDPAAAESAHSTTVRQTEDTSQASRRGVASRKVIRHYAKWFLVLGIGVLFGVGLDVFLLQTLAGWRHAGLIALSIGCICIFIYSRRKPEKIYLQVSSKNAFHGLSSFQEKDRKCFYGRENDTSAIFEMVCRNGFRFGVLYGNSGCGKTSLLMAGLAPKLKEHGFLALCCRLYKDPLETLVEECQKRNFCLAL